MPWPQPGAVAATVCAAAQPDRRARSREFMRALLPLPTFLDALNSPADNPRLCGQNYFLDFHS
jgi:hypothetical protein